MGMEDILKKRLRREKDRGNGLGLMTVKKHHSQLKRGKGIK